MATFADLMSLLMCFFVLLLSFSEMDIQKFKQVAGSMDKAFGVQREIRSDTIPRGTSVIKQEFSPGIPQPTAIKIMKQETSDDTQEELRMNTSVSENLQELMNEIKEVLDEEIAENVLEVLMYEDAVLIRVREKDAFPSGSAELQSGFTSVLDKLQSVLDETNGRIIVSGHTDSVPIATSAYPSNWVLSAARAASVVHHLSEINFTDPSRIEIRAFADTIPVAPNDTPDNRAKNRRIEISVGVEGG
ncbi:MAG: OmpA family protein [Granulosicoccus sp.]|nr:OmpA family protein [Granulosicoccus sp.]